MLDQICTQENALQLLIDDIEHRHHAWHGNQARKKALHQMPRALIATNVRHQAETRLCPATYQSETQVIHKDGIGYDGVLPSSWPCCLVLTTSNGQATIEANVPAGYPSITLVQGSGLLWL